MEIASNKREDQRRQQQDRRVVAQERCGRQAQQEHREEQPGDRRGSRSKNPGGHGIDRARLLGREGRDQDRKDGDQRAPEQFRCGHDVTRCDVPARSRHRTPARAADAGETRMREERAGRLTASATLSANVEDATKGRMPAIIRLFRALFRGASVKISCRSRHSPAGRCRELSIWLFRQVAAPRNRLWALAVSERQLVRGEIERVEGVWLDSPAQILASALAFHHPRHRQCGPGPGG